MLTGCGQFLVFICKQKTAYELRSSDWSSDVCSSDLAQEGDARLRRADYLLGVSFRVGRDDAQYVAHLPPRRAVAWPVFVGRFRVDQTAHGDLHEIGRAHVRTPVTNAHLVCRLLLEKKKNNK